MKRGRARRHWLYPTLAYVTVVALVFALALRPSLLFLGVVTALGCILVLAAVHHLRQGRVAKDAYLEYVLVLAAVLFVLVTALRH